MWQIAIIQFRFQLVFWRTAFYFISDENRTLGFSETRLNRLSHVQLPFFESKEIIIFHFNVLFMFYWKKFRFKFRYDDFATFPLFRALRQSELSFCLALGWRQNELTRLEINLLNME